MGRVIKSCVLYESTQEEIFTCGFLMDLSSRTIYLCLLHVSLQSDPTVMYSLMRM